VGRRERRAPKTHDFVLIHLHDAGRTVVAYTWRKPSPAEKADSMSLHVSIITEQREQLHAFGVQLLTLNDDIRAAQEELRVMQDDGRSSPAALAGVQRTITSLQAARTVLIGDYQALKECCQAIG
jgi:hypothetical protein